eukprot:scaffold16223_cov66-Phaeocystis_antarctica.AAC.6
MRPISKIGSCSSMSTAMNEANGSLSMVARRRQRGSGFGTASFLTFVEAATEHQPEARVQ